MACYRSPHGHKVAAVALDIASSHDSTQDAEARERSWRGRERWLKSSVFSVHLLPRRKSFLGDSSTGLYLIDQKKKKITCSPLGQSLNKEEEIVVICLDHSYICWGWAQGLMGVVGVMLC